MLAEAATATIIGAASSAVGDVVTNAVEGNEITLEGIGKSALGGGVGGLVGFGAGRLASKILAAAKSVVRKASPYKGTRNPQNDFLNKKGNSTLARHAEKHGGLSTSEYLEKSRNFLEKSPTSTTESFVANDGTYFRYDTATNEFGIINMVEYLHIFIQMMESLIG